MAKPAKTKPVTAADLVNVLDGVGSAATDTTRTEAGSTDAPSVGAAPSAAAAPTSEPSISGTAADAGVATLSTGAASHDIAPGAAMLLTVPAAPTSGETKSLASPETPQLGAAAGDIFKVAPIIGATGPASALATSLTRLGGFDAGQLERQKPETAEEERRWFLVASPILRDGEHHGVGDPIEVTKDEHKASRASQSITEEWDD